MIRMLSIVAIVFVISTSATAMTPGPIFYQDGMIAKIALGCGVGINFVNLRAVRIFCA